MASDLELDTNYNYIGVALRAVGLSLCAVIFATSAGFAFWTKCGGKEDVVCASQPIFLFIICAGVFLMGAAIIPLSVDDEIATDRGCDIACNSIPYLFCVGFSLVFSALFCKMKRVNMIFNNASALKKVKVTVLDVSKPIFALLICNFLVLGLQTGLDPYVWVREELSPIGSIGYCTSEDAMPYMIVLAALNLSAMVGALFQAWQVRNISVEFSESKFIAMAAGSTLLTCFVGIPAMAIAGDQPKTHFYILSSLDFVLCMSLLLFIFVPKEKLRRSKVRVKDTVLALMSRNNGRSHASRNVRNNTVLLCLHETEAGPIDLELQSSEVALDVNVMQGSKDILRFVQEKRPAIVVLDHQLCDGSTGFEICEEIRISMGTWGEHAILVVIGSSDICHDRAQSEKEQLIAEKLCLADYIRGPYSLLYLRTLVEMSVLRVPLLWRRSPFSIRESQRLAALHRTHLLDTEPEERFDRITRLCTAMFDVPISLVSLVDDDRQFFKSNVGLEGTCQTHRDGAFCAHSILEDDVMVVPNAIHDSRFANNPLVEGGPKIRFYAGCPLEISSWEGTRHKLGTLCIIDSKPREMSEEELRAFRDFGKMVEREIDRDVIIPLTNACKKTSSVVW